MKAPVVVARIKIIIIAAWITAAAVTTQPTSGVVAVGESAIINGILYQDKYYRDLDKCIKLGTLDIVVENRTDGRTALIYESDNCAGAVVGSVGPSAKGSAYGASLDFKIVSSGASESGHSGGY
ncbi:hypothetical protein ABZW96_37260 [Nocardia sp. NPDC004168]|uniref:hypothetical protein n=1 Tax=Nocardia sp. NPDC004168 TaxID=3154452 RepID=UPI0033AA4BD5